MFQYTHLKMEKNIDIICNSKSIIQIRILGTPLSICIQDLLLITQTNNGCFYQRNVDFEISQDIGKCHYIVHFCYNKQEHIGMWNTHWPA